MITWLTAEIEIMLVSALVMTSFAVLHYCIFLGTCIPLHWVDHNEWRCILGDNVDVRLLAVSDNVFSLIKWPLRRGVLLLLLFCCCIHWQGYVVHSQRMTWTWVKMGKYECGLWRSSRRRSCWLIGQRGPAR